MTATRLTLAALLALTTSTPAFADPVIDGDTLRAEPRNLRLTLRGGAPYDAPETWRPGCAAEAELGALATETLRRLLADGYRVHVLPGRDRWGRGLAWIELPDGRDAGDALIAVGLAAPSINADWCGGGP